MAELISEWASQPPERREQFLREHLMANIADQLRRAISRNCPMDGSGESYYSLAQRAGVSGEQISRFMAGERDLRLESAAKLAEALGMELRFRG